MGAKFFQMNFKQNFFCGKSASMHQVHLMQLLVVRAETHEVTRITAWHFPIWGNALLGILSFYENVCKVQLESSVLYKWPLCSHALVQVSRLSIDATGTLLSSHKQAKIHRCDSIICAPWSVKMMCNGNVYMRRLVGLEHSPPAARRQIRKWQVWSDFHFLLMSLHHMHSFGWALMPCLQLC